MVGKGGRTVVWVGAVGGRPALQRGRRGGGQAVGRRVGRAGGRRSAGRAMSRPAQGRQREGSSSMRLANVSYHSVLSDSVGTELLPDVCFLQLRCYTNRKHHTCTHIRFLPGSARCSQGLMRSPKLLATSCILFGNLRQSPSTLQDSVLQRMCR